MKNFSRIRCGLVVGMATLLAACASAPVSFQNAVMVDDKGMTLYTFDKDVARTGKSVCNGPCAKNWPPLLATKDDKASGQYSILTRDDGALQWAYDGKPLYRWIKDAKPGDKTGDGFNNAWRVVTAPQK